MGHDLTDDLLARIDDLVDHPTQRTYDPWRDRAVGRWEPSVGAAVVMMAAAAAMRQSTMRRMAAQIAAAREAMVRQFVVTAAFRDAVRRAIAASRERPVPVKPSARSRYQRRR